VVIYLSIDLLKPQGERNIMEKVFKFLTKQDLALLLERGERVSYAKNETILEENSQRWAIFVIHKGLVRVEQAHLGRGIAVARLGEGDIFGEMSFLEERGASASIVAEEDVEVDVIEGPDIYSLIASVPGLSSRFYQSLAILLSERLRQTTRQLPPLMVEEVSQVKRFHAQRTGHINFDQLPAGIINAAEDFKTAMLTIDSTLKNRKSPYEEAQKQVNIACNAIHDSLRDCIRQERHLENGIGAYVFRETFSFFMLSAFLDRAYTKPRGYAGDYYTNEIIYQNNPTGDGRLGAYIDAWALSTPFARAVQNCRASLAQFIKEVAKQWHQPGPMPITSLASGSARELFDLFADRERPDILATCVDIDNEALTYTANIARDMGLTNQMSFVQDNVVRMARGRGKTVLQPQQLIYSVGLIDYLKQEDYIVSLLDWIFDNLLPGGRAILGNFDISNPNKEFMGHVIEWVLIHRSADDLRNLFAQSKFGSRPVQVISESAGVQLFAICTKD
jgi:CRP-like cAMP-binding protein